MTSTAASFVCVPTPLFSLASGKNLFFLFFLEKRQASSSDEVFVEGLNCLNVFLPQCVRSVVQLVQVCVLLLLLLLLRCKKLLCFLFLHLNCVVLFDGFFQLGSCNLTERYILLQRFNQSCDARTYSGRLVFQLCNSLAQFFHCCQKLSICLPLWQICRAEFRSWKR